MKRTIALAAVIACFPLVFSACANENKTPADSKAATVKTTTSVKPEASKAATKTAEPQVPANKQGKPKFIIANKELTNLQLDDPTIPVYDLLSVEERHAQGLPTRLPEIKPYNKGKVAYLTFDDGPDDKNTEAVLDILKQENVKGTFYVLGSYCYNYPQTLTRMINEGHAIGNHSFSHEYGRLYPSINGFMSEMFATEKVEREIIGFRSFIIRAPGGKYSQFTSEYPPALKAAGLVEHDWNVCIDDAVGGHPTAADFVQKVDKQTADGKSSAIVLMHSTYGKEETVKALPQIIQLLRDRGYTFGVVTPMTPQPW